MGADDGQGERTGARRALALLGTIGFLLATALLLAAARGDLWFDEVVSMGYARAAHGVWDLVERFHVDNNHVLNTWYLWALGPDRQQVYVYRLLAVGSGVALLGLLAWSAGRRGAAAGVLALWLAGSAYPLVLYGSEARGYAPAMCAAVLAWAALERSWRRLGPAIVLLFWTAIVLGFLAHLTFVMVAAALGAAEVVHELRAPGRWPGRLGRLGLLFAPPLVVSGAFVGDFARGMLVIGGPVYPYRDVLGAAAALALGLPDTAGGRMVAAISYLAVVGTGALVTWLERPEEAVFFGVVLLAAPLGLLAVTRPEHLYFRYFVVVFPFLYLLLAIVLAAACRGRPWRWAPALVVLLACWGVGHAARLGPLLTLGRGSTSAMLRYVAAHSPAGELRIGCDSETTMLVEFAAPRVLPGRTVHCLGNAAWMAEAPEWLVIRSLGRFYEAPPQMEFVPGHEYLLVEADRFGGGSGWSTFLYRRGDAAAAAGPS